MSESLVTHSSTMMQKACSASPLTVVIRPSAVVLNQGAAKFREVMGGCTISKKVDNYSSKN